MMKARILPLLIVLATPFVTACGGLLPKAAPFDVYRLPDPVATASSAAPVAWQLRVTSPDAPRMLSGPHIAVVHGGTQVSVYAGARWAEAVPQLVRDRLIAAFRADGRVAMVSSDDDDLGADFTLGSRLDAFQADYTGHDNKPVVTIRLEAWLLPAGAGKPVANRSFVASAPAANEAVTAVVAAFGQAADDIDRQIVAWTVATGSKATPAR